ncbi:hypothetical protein JCM10296v2_006023 [Rhodotorula toruloides]
MATTQATDDAYKPCEQCFAGYKLDGEPKGTMGELGGLGYYLAAGKAEEKDRAIVLGTDIFGLGLANCKILADWFADKTGFPVFVPDYFEGDYIDTSTIKPQLTALDEPMKNKSFLQRTWTLISLVSAMLVKVGPRYLYRHRMSRCVPLAEKFCRDLREQKGFKRLGCIGYCWGGALAVLLAGEDSPLDTAICFHPGNLTVKNFEDIRRPFMLVCSEEDMSFNSIKPAALTALASLSATHNIPTKVYDDNPGTVHGFGCRPRLSDPRTREAFERGLERSREWFVEHL